MDDVRTLDGNSSWHPSGALFALLLAAFLIRAVYPGQPLVENYVGRQIPTAMVARNLDRGSGLLRPQIETAPFPNYFVVEPPIYEFLVVVLNRTTSVGLSEAGRVVSALFSALAAWGVFVLARRREGVRVALLAVLVFSVFPLTIRYGRAFQPDASMLGAAVAGLACWDRSLARPSPCWRAFGWCLLAVGIAIKITSSFLLLPLFWMIGRQGKPRDFAAACATLVPALLWYLWASHLIGQGVGSRASADNRSIWLSSLGPAALLDPATIKVVGWSLLVRAFTPLGAGLALFGLWKQRSVPAQDGAFWWVWGAFRNGGHVASGGQASPRVLLAAPGARRGRRRRPCDRAVDRAAPTARGRSPGSGARCSLHRSDAVDMANSCRVDESGNGRPGGDGESCRQKTGSRLPRRSCFSPTGAAAGWNGRPPQRKEPPESGARPRPTSKAPSI